MEKDVARIALFAALIAALGLVPAIPLPFTGGVPITLQSMGIMLAGLVLGPWRGALAVLVLEAVVAMGAPLLSGGRGGLGVFAGPTVGFLIGWVAAAVVTGLLYQTLSQRMKPMLAGIIASVVGGIGVLYACGVPGMALITGMPLAKAVMVVAVFIPGDLLKAVLAAFINREIRRSGRLGI